MEELSAYEVWGREQVAQNAELTYTELRRLLERDQAVTAANDTMGRWLASLLDAPKAYGRYRSAACSALESLSMEELSAYDVWGRETVGQNAEITYSELRRLLEREHHVTAADDTMRRWLASLLIAPRAYGRFRSAACSALESLSMEELSAYDDWGREQVSQNAS